MIRNVSLYILNSLLNTEIYEKSTAPRKSQLNDVNISIPEFKKLPTTDNECEKYDWNFQYNKKENSLAMLENRFKLKTKCRQSGCQWRRGGTSCRNFLKEENGIKIVVSGKTFQKISLFNKVTQFYIQGINSNELKELKAKKSDNYIKFFTSNNDYIPTILGNKYKNMEKSENNEKTQCMKILYGENNKTQNGGSAIKYKIYY